MAVEADRNHFQDPVEEIATHPKNCDETGRLRDEVLKENKEFRNEINSLKSRVKTENYDINQLIIKWRNIFGFILCVIIAALLGVYLILWKNNSDISEVYQKQENRQINFMEEIKESVQHIISEELKKKEIVSDSCSADLYNIVSDQDPSIFTMTRVGNHKKYSDRWTSSPIYTHDQGYKICLRVIANGSSFGKGTHVSVFLHFMRGEFDDRLKWPFRGAISFRLLDQQGGKNHRNGTVTYDDNVGDSICTRVREEEVGKGEWGYIEFIPHEELEPYLKEDTLVFQIYEVELH